MGNQINSLHKMLPTFGNDCLQANTGPFSKKTMPYNTPDE